MRHGIALQRLVCLGMGAALLASAAPSSAQPAAPPAGAARRPLPEIVDRYDVREALRRTGAALHHAHDDLGDLRALERGAWPGVSADRIRARLRVVADHLRQLERSTLRLRRELPDGHPAVATLGELTRMLDHARGELRRSHLHLVNDERRLLRRSILALDRSLGEARIHHQTLAQELGLRRSARGAG